MGKSAHRTVILLTAFAVLGGCGGGGGKSGGATPPPPANSLPVASFSATPSSGAAPLTVHVDASASSDPDGAIASYSWNFGDQSGPGAGRTASHVYRLPSTFSITLTVADSQGAVATASRQVTVTDPLVPNIVGLSEAAARTEIIAAGFTIGVVSSGSSSSVPAGNVISQSPIGGTVASPGTAVSLVVSSGPGGGVPPIQIKLNNPQPGGFVPDQAAIMVHVSSTYEIRSITASMAGRETTLEVDADSCPSGPPCAIFVGNLSLVGVATGPLPLAIRAVDVRGNVEQLTANVVHDNPPTLTVVQPLNDSVALPTLPLEIRCSDDLPGCLVEARELRSRLPPTTGELFAAAPGGVSASLDLSRWIGSPVTLLLRADDAAGQRTEVERQIFVESPARLRVATEVPGEIVDADGMRLLSVDRQANGDRLAIYDRATAVTEVIPLPEGKEVWDSYLTPSGAAFVAQGVDQSSLTARLHFWREGTLTEIDQILNSSGSLRVSGDYAIWNGGENLGDDDLYRMNTATGVFTLVSTEAANSENAVAADGTVVFWATGTYQIVRDRAGQQETLTSDATQWHMSPVTDGPNVVYRQSDASPPRRHAIWMIEGYTPRPLAEKREQEPQPGLDYQIAAGWAAFTDLGSQGQLHVFTRSPQGVITRHTDLSTSSRIDRLAGNGEIMAVSGGQRYFSRGAGMVPISSFWGKSYWLNGAWHVAIGRALLAVDTRDP